jgi:hypothetical protein
MTFFAGVRHIERGSRGRYRAAVRWRRRRSGGEVGCACRRLADRRPSAHLAWPLVLPRLGLLTVVLDRVLGADDTSTGAEPRARLGARSRSMPAESTRRPIVSLASLTRSRRCPPHPRTRHSPRSAPTRGRRPEPVGRARRTGRLRHHRRGQPVRRGRPRRDTLCRACADRLNGQAWRRRTMTAMRPPEAAPGGLRPSRPPVDLRPSTAGPTDETQSGRLPTPRPRTGVSRSATAGWPASAGGTTEPTPRRHIVRSSR